MHSIKRIPKKNQKRIEEIGSILANLNETYHQALTQRESTKSLVDRNKDINEHINKLRIQAEQAMNQSDYALSAEITYGQIPTLQKQLQQIQDQIQDAKDA